MSSGIVPVILAGGQGRRLRPITSRNRPKPFLKIFSSSSFYQDALKRVQIFNAPIVVSEERHLPIIKKQNNELDLEPSAIILEPQSRNTAAAALTAAFYLNECDDLMLVIPSDHVWADEGAFQKIIAAAALRMDPDKVCMVGVAPLWASSRYGYIQAGDGLSVEKFIEKPNKALACQYLKMDDICWNSGVFLCRPKILLQQARNLCPDIYESIEKSMNEAKKSGENVIIPEKSQFVKTPSISIDYAILEKCRDLQLVKYKGDWSDIGTKSALLGLCFKKIMSR